MHYRQLTHFTYVQRSFSVKWQWMATMPTRRAGALFLVAREWSLLLKFSWHVKSQVQPNEKKLSSKVITWHCNIEWEIFTGAKLIFLIMLCLLNGAPINNIPIWLSTISFIQRPLLFFPFHNWGPPSPIMLLASRLIIIWYTIPVFVHPMISWVSLRMRRW